jgi:hypothetical protein
MIDKIDPSILQNEKDLYSSKKIQDAIGIVSELSGYPVKSIFPCRLYHNDADRDLYVDTLALRALREALGQVTIVFPFNSDVLYA